MFNTYEERKVDRIEPEDNNGVGVSTAWTVDEGYETALLDTNGVHPVERYPDLERAKIGHQYWVGFAKNPDNNRVTKLGSTYFGTPHDRITLERY